MSDAPLTIPRPSGIDRAADAHELVVVGVSHRTAPLAIRERLAFSSSEIGAALDALGSVALEALVLSTCNRVELYAVVPRDGHGAESMVALLAATRQVDVAVIRPAAYTHRSEAAVRHLHAVAVGLDSLVLGETEILAQLRGALSIARSRGTLGLLLDRLGASAVNGARWAHRRHGSVRRDSIAERALREIDRIRGTGHGIRGATVTVLGAGRLATRVCALARDAGAGRLVVANRSIDHATALAARYEGEAWAWERRHEALAEADVALLCSGARERVVDVAALAAARLTTGDRPLICVDLAVPRALDGDAAAALVGVTLLDVDALQRPGVVGAEATYIAALERSVDVAVARFDAWRRARVVGYAERATRGGAA